MSLYKGNNLISGAMPNSANQSLSNLDSAGQDKFDEKVNKSGDTITGDLRIRNSHPTIKAENIDIRRGQTPSVDYYGDMFMITDTDGNGMGALGQTYFRSGNHTTRIWQRGATSNVYSVLDIGIDENDIPYCNFPNTTRCDGQWVTTTFYEIANTSITGTTNLPYSLASYLPNDNYDYEVLIRARTTTTSTSGSTTIAYVNSSLVTNWISIAGGQTRTNSSVQNYGACIIPISSDKTIYLHRESAYTGTVQLILLAYRRIGTNN
jgi:hypothetical protein